ncbi:MAG: hypothetical protein AUK31_07670 [Fibrobacteres bacterium CG2_30_45_31]|nr:MAG: hypothetical protein AUK31_07670 [Fibrobacteres bacterium CG2_30_45_31]
MNRKTFSPLEVTDVEIYPYEIEKEGITKAIATVILNDQLQLNGLSIVDMNHGLDVASPSQPVGFHPFYLTLTHKLRDEIKEKVLAKYKLTKEENNAKA